MKYIHKGEIALMKMKVFKFVKNKENKEKATNFENILFGVCILCFIILIAVQIILVTPVLRDKLNLTDTSIGLPLNGDEYLYNQGQITLKIVGEDPDPLLRILINGDFVAAFEKTEMDVSVKDGDVIEIDGSQTSVPHIVQVKSISANVSNKCKNASATVNSNIQKLVKVRVN